MMANTMASARKAFGIMFFSNSNQPSIMIFSFHGHTLFKEPSIKPVRSAKVELRKRAKAKERTLEN